MLTRSQARKRLQPASPALEVMFAVPALFTSLTPTARAALSACNRQLQAFVRCSVQVIHVEDAFNISQICKSIWPQLALAMLPTKQAGVHRTSEKQPSSLDGYVSGKLALLAALELITQRQSTHCT